MNPRFLLASLVILLCYESSLARTRLIAPVERGPEARPYANTGEWSAALSFSGTLPLSKPFARIDGGGEDFDLRALSGIGIELRRAQDPRWDSGLRIQYQAFESRASAAPGSLTQFESAELKSWSFDVSSELRFSNSGFVPLMEGTVGLARTSFRLDSTDVSVATAEAVFFRPRASLGIGGAMLWWEPLRLKLTAGIDWQHLGNKNFQNSVYNVNRRASVGGLFMRSSIAFAF
jgi:hypothetical protein